MMMSGSTSTMNRRRDRRSTYNPGYRICLAFANHTYVEFLEYVSCCAGSMTMDTPTPSGMWQSLR